MQPFFEAPAERIAPDGFERAVGSVGLVILATSSGCAQIDPIGSLIAGTSKEARVDEGFEPVNGVGIESGPVSWDDGGGSCQQMGSEIGDTDPWKHEKAGVVGEQMEIFLPQSSIPSNEAVPASDMPWSRRPREAGNGSPFGKGQVFEMLSNRPCIPQIVKLSKECVMGPLKRSPSNLKNIDGIETGDVRFDGTLIDQDGLRCSTVPSPSSTLPWRQPDEAFCLKA